jgi:DNA-binding transcriptional regulator LsrR (DeoR family)
MWPPPTADAYPPGCPILSRLRQARRNRPSRPTPRPVGTRSGCSKRCTRAAGSGRSLSAIARELGLNRRTVAKYARATSWQECVRRTPPRRTTSLDPYLEYLRQRWDEGERTATVLHQEITAKTSDAVDLSSGSGELLVRWCGEDGRFVVADAFGEAVMEAADHAVEKVALSGGVTVSVVASPVIVGLGAG